MAMAMAVEGQNARHKRNTYLQQKVNETLLLPHKSAPPPLLLPTHDAKVRERDMHTYMHAPPPLSNPLTSLFFSLNPLKIVLECESCFLECFFLAAISSSTFCWGFFFFLLFLGKENYSWCVAECFILYSVFIYHARIIYL